MKNTQKNVKDAFLWILGILRKYKIPFQITGGFAANIYGSDRPLADIDIDIPDGKIFEIQNDVKEFIIYGPKRYKDEEFDLLLMTLDYRGQEIDICGLDSQKLFNKKTRQWEFEKIDLSRAKKKKVYNKLVSVIELKELICYKKKIAREVDIYDVKLLTEKAREADYSSMVAL